MTKNVQQRLLKVARDIETGEYSKAELRAQKDYQNAAIYRTRVREHYLKVKKEYKRLEKELDKAEDLYDAAAEALHHVK